MNGDHEARLRKIERDEWIEIGVRKERTRANRERNRLLKWALTAVGFLSPLLVKLGAWIAKLLGGEWPTKTH